MRTYNEYKMSNGMYLTINQLIKYQQFALNEYRGIFSLDKIKKLIRPVAVIKVHY